MTTEELLIPRFECIGRYPNSPLIEGDTYTTKEACVILNPNNVVGCVQVFDFTRYPAIFKKLEWWEKREIKDLPKFVKTNTELNKKQIHKVVTWTDLWIKQVRLFNENVSESNFDCDVRICTPATEEEYKNSIK